MLNSYLSVSSAYDTSIETEHNQESYERERVSDEMNEKLNEIFDNLDDTTKHSLL